MRKTESESFDLAVLENRIAVSNKELSFMLGVGLTTAKKIAEDANAVCKVGRRRVINVHKVIKYLEAISENN